MISSKLHFKKQGAGPPLIVLHGIFGSGDNWQSLANVLQDQYSVYLIDQRNHGRSFHTEAFSLDLLAEDIKEFVEAESLERVNILAHSMGGKVALKFLSKYPELVDHIIIVDIAPKEYPAGHNDIFKAMIEFPLHQIQSRNEADLWMQQSIPDPVVRQFILKNLHRNDAGGFEWKLNLESIHKNYENILSSVYPEQIIDHDLLFILGEKSNYITDLDKINILAKYPNAIFKTIADAGHWVHANNFSSFLSTVKEYLK